MHEVNCRGVPHGPSLQMLFRKAILLALVKIDTVLAAEANRMFGQDHKLRDLYHKIRNIRMHLMRIKSDTRQIGTVNVRDDGVRGWIAEVRKLDYHIEDVMDIFLYFSFNTVFKDITVFISKIAEEVAKIERDSEQVTRFKEQFLGPSQLVPVELSDMERQQSPVRFFYDEDLVGIESNRRTLIEWVLSRELGSMVIAVSGMGGLGKTALVRSVYERARCMFPAHAWMVMSNTYSIDDLLRNLLRQFGDVEQHLSALIDKMDGYDLRTELTRRLNDKECLIVLDDVCCDEWFLHIRDAFQYVYQCCIIITTRKNHVAALAPATRRICLQPLNHTDAFNLFCRTAFHNTEDRKCPAELESIASDIVRRCEGFPLVIVSIGSLLSLRPQTSDVWEQMLDQFQCEVLTNDKIRAILDLSYHELSGDVKSCFLYCCLFPDIIPCDSLMRMWVAECFVTGTENYTAEEVAERNLKELINCNLLQVCMYHEQGRSTACVMYNIVRYLALPVAKEEKFSTGNYDVGSMTLMDNDVRRLTLCCWRGMLPNFIHPRLRALMLFGSTFPQTYMLSLLSSIFSESCFLSVIELQDSDVSEVPASIGTLFNLRYIGLRGTKVKSLPESVVNLYKLHTLDIKATNIQELPRGIGKAKKIRHLFADRCAVKNEVDMYLFGETSQHMYKKSEFPNHFGVQAPTDLSHLEELESLETVQSSTDLADQLKTLWRLRSVWIDTISTTECANLFDTLSDMPLLSSLLLCARDENEVLSFETLWPRTLKLRRLIIIGPLAAGTLECPVFLHYGTYLKHLALSFCHLGEDPLKIIAQHFPNLAYLRLDNISSATTSAGSLVHLKTIVLKHMPNVNKMVIGDGALICVENMYIVSLAELAKVPEGIESLCFLKKLWLLYLNSDFNPNWYINGMHTKMSHVLEVRVQS